MTATGRSSHQTSARDGDRRLEIAACSDQGPVRHENQDAWSVHPLEGRGALLILADGMGGHADGAAAAYLAVTSATERLRAADDPHTALAAAVEDANQAVARRRLAEGGRVSGTTLVAAVVAGSRVTLANVGDSRAYLVRDGSARQVTQDHSWLADQVRAGTLDGDQLAPHDARRNFLTRAVTGDPVEPDGFSFDVAAGDTLVLCSDGAWDMLDDAGIAAAVEPARPLLECVEHAVEQALEAGATDNVTVVACRVVSAQR